MIDSYLKESAFTAVKKGCKVNVLNKVCERGTIVNKRYTKEVRFSKKKMMYKRVRGWTSGRRLPV